MQKYYWSGYCHETRVVAIDKIASIINNYGLLLSANQFSDLDIGFTIEIASIKVRELYSALSSYIGLAEPGEVTFESTGEITIMLNVSFTNGKGNLKIEVPAVPG